MSLNNAVSTRPVRSWSVSIHRNRTWPLLPVVLLTAVALHAFSTILMLLAAWDRGGGYRFPFWEVTSLWDGQWFHSAVVEGYPAQLPQQPDGSVVQNQWAFYPAFPKLASGLMTVTGGSFELVGVLVSLAFSLLAVGLMVPLLEPHFGARVTWAATVLVGLWPAAPILQMTYSESMGLAAVVAALLAIDRHRWGWAIAIAPLCGLTRPVAGPLTLLMALLTVLAWRSASNNTRAWLFATTAAYGAASLLWPAFAWARTGRMMAYFDTEGSWRDGHMVPFRLGAGHPDQMAGNLAALAVIAFVIAAAFAFLWRHGGRRLGTVLRAWCGIYVVYLSLAAGVTTSFPRMMYPAFPLAAVAIDSALRQRFGLGRKTWFVLLSSVLAVLQVVWVVIMLTGRVNVAP